MVYLSQLSFFLFTNWAPLRATAFLSPGEQVLALDLEAKDAVDASLRQLIPRVFEALGPLRPLRLLLPDGRSWQETSETSETSLEQLGAAGYPR